MHKLTTTRRQLSDAWDRARSGVFWGLLVAALYSAWATVLHVGRGPGAVEDVGLTLGRIVATYAVAGLLGGAVVGTLMPLGRSRAGAALVGVVCASVVGLPILTSVKGPPWSWTGTHWKALATFGLVFGLPVSQLWFRKPPRAVRARDTAPRLRTVHPPPPDAPET